MQKNKAAFCALLWTALQDIQETQQQLSSKLQTCVQAAPASLYEAQCILMLLQNKTARKEPGGWGQDQAGTFHLDPLYALPVESCKYSTCLENKPHLSPLLPVPEN